MTEIPDDERASHPEADQRGKRLMAAIHQEVVVRSGIACAVWDCHARLTVDVVVNGSVDDVYSGRMMIGVARSESTTKLLEESKSQGWVIGAHDNLCPAHVRAAVYEYMNAAKAASLAWPIDCQFQSLSESNEYGDKVRNPMGMPR